MCSTLGLSHSTLGVPSVRLSAPAQLLSDRKGGGVTEKHFCLAVKGPAVELRGQLECLACFKQSEVVF